MNDRSAPKWVTITLGQNMKFVFLYRRVRASMKAAILQNPKRTKGNNAELA